MTEVTPDTVARVARLARLSLSEDETLSLANDLRQILDYASSLDSLDLQGVPPMSHARAVEKLRSDEVLPVLSHSDALRNAPDSSGQLFRVPRVMGGSNE